MTNGTRFLMRALASGIRATIGQFECEYRCRNALAVEDCECLFQRSDGSDNDAMEAFDRIRKIECEVDVVLDNQDWLVA